MAWALLMGLMLFWTTYKQRQATEALKLKHEQQKIDSLANLGKRNSHEAMLGNADSSGSSTIGSSEKNAKSSVGSQSGQATLVEKGDSASAANIGVTVAHRKISVETNKFTLTLDNQGALLEELDLKELAGKKPLNPKIIPDEGGALSLTLNNKDLSKINWEVDAGDSSYRVTGAPKTISFKATLPGTNTVVTRSFTFYPDSNKFTHNFSSSDPLTSYSIGWESGLGETEHINHGKGFGLLTTFFSEVVLNNGSNVQRESFEGKKTFNAESGVVKWVGLRRKYLAAVLNFNRETTNKVIATGRIPEGEDKSFPKNYKMEIVSSSFEEKDLDFDFEVLPLSYDQLLGHHDNYEKIIFSGWENFLRADIWYVALCGFVLHLLNFFHGIIPNYGIAIILLTLLVRIITFPLTIAQTKQGVKMQQHMPAIAKIREKNKGNPQKANTEIMEYYKKEGVNPLSGVMGCFPVLLQMPIFISLFNVLGRAVELKGAPFVFWIHDLALPDVVFEAIKIPYIFPLGITILPFFMSITMYFQMKLSIKDPNQKMMVWLMPIMMFVFSCAFPSGLVLYWTVSNLFTIGQTYFYTNKLSAASGKPGSPAKPEVGTYPKPKVS